MDGQTFYFRRYPQGDLASNIVGYSTQARSRAGLERSLNDYLTGSNGEPAHGARHQARRAGGEDHRRQLVTLTIDPSSSVPRNARSGNCGAAVALDPSTGAVLAMATSPGYDANQVERNYRQILGTGRVLAGGAAPQPRHRRPVCAGLDVQARDGRGGARHREGDA